MKINWDKIRDETNAKIDLLEALDEKDFGQSATVADKMRKDLIIPLVALIAEFCEAVVVTEAQRDVVGDDA